MFGIGGGPSSREKNDYNNLTNYYGFAGKMGENDLTKSSDFFNAILSGDMGKISQLLAPQIATMQKQGENAKATAANFGNRSGGTNAYMNSVGDATTGSIDRMIGELTGTAASQLGLMGENLLGQGMTGAQAAFSEAKTMQEQEQARWNDIFKSIGQVVGGAAGFFPAGSGMSKVLTGAQGVLQG